MDPDQDDDGTGFSPGVVPSIIGCVVSLVALIGGIATGEASLVNLGVVSASLFAAIAAASARVGRINTSRDHERSHGAEHEDSRSAS